MQTQGSSENRKAPEKTREFFFAKAQARPRRYWRVEAARILRVGGSVEDNQTLEALLRGAGQNRVEAATPAQAIEEITARQADLVLLDMLLASNDVFAVLRAAAPSAGKTSRTPVIVTGPASVNDRVQACLQRGAEDFLTTPFDPQNALLVSRRIDLCLQRKHLREFTVRLRAERPNDAGVVELYSDAASRFVPREFLENLGRNSLAEVRLGDHVQRDMTVFFADIRDFTTLSETMTPQENFEFLNSYLRRVTPIIRANHGFIDKYIGDGIMALFPREPVDALKTAVELQRELVKYNEGRRKAGYQPIRVGIGLNYGELILGTIGEDERMQTTVISDAVNVASRVEGLTKTYGVSLLVGKPLVDKLPSSHGFHLRHLGAVRAKGKTKSVEIYECFDNDSRDLFEHKVASAELFAKAVGEFRKGLYLSAGTLFARIAQLNAHDTVAAYYRDACTLSIMPDRERDLDHVEIH
jgi:two-component system, sensor histidine kinase ChiS